MRGFASELRGIKGIAMALLDAAENYGDGQKSKNFLVDVCVVCADIFLSNETYFEVLCCFCLDLPMLYIFRRNFTSDKLYFYLLFLQVIS